MDFKENLETIFSRLENMFKAKTVIGNPIKIGEVTLVPIVNVTFGIGACGEESKDSKEQGGGGLGAGSGARLTPSAIIVIKGDQVSMLPIASKGSIENIIEKVPEVVEKLKKIMQKETNETQETHKTHGTHN